MIRTICYITPSVHLLGARISLSELLLHLDRNKYRPLVVCPMEGDLTDLLKEHDIEVRIIRFGNWRKVKHWPLIPQAVYNLTELGREEKIDLWHSNEFWTFPYIYYASRRLGQPAICHFRCSRSSTRLPPRKIKMYRLHKADYIITVSESRREIFRAFPDLQQRITVIPNGVNLDKFIDLQKNLFRNELDISDGEYLIGMIGLVSEHKGVTDILMAMANLVQRKVPVKAVIVGPDSPKGHLEKMKSLAGELNVLEHVIFTGFRKDIPNIMKDLDLLVTPSREEAFGRVLIEAMAAGTPIVATVVGGIPEIISSPDTGVLVPPGNPEALATAIEDLLANPQRRISLAAQAHQRIVRNYSIQQHVEKIQEFYDRVFSGRD
ncbi:glycosyltransferase family 4 protein [bacterium]|nr:glycosyltransferase family 4 protein [candidate division CSSED10-310 bacterium]